MDTQKGRVFSIAVENRPVPGCTVSQLAEEKNGYYILHFSLKEGSHINSVLKDGEVFALKDLLPVQDGKIINMDLVNDVKKAAAFGCYGWSGESVKILQETLKEAGFDVAAASVKCNWNPQEADYAAIAPMVTELLS